MSCDTHIGPVSGLGSTPLSAGVSCMYVVWAGVVKTVTVRKNRAKGNVQRVMAASLARNEKKIIRNPWQRAQRDGAAFGGELLNLVRLSGCNIVLTLLLSKGAGPT